MDFEGFCAVFGTYVPPAVEDGERYYLIAQDLLAFRVGEQRKPYLRGLYLGMGKKDFVPTSALLQILAQHSKRKATVSSERAEWLFLCGRDVFADGFSSEQTNGMVLVQNSRDENLGLGNIVKNSKGEFLLKNILDLGNYLRHEKTVLNEKQSRAEHHQRRHKRWTKNT